jgi:hypothetical protein
MCLPLAPSQDQDAHVTRREQVKMIFFSFLFLGQLFRVRGRPQSYLI